MSEVRAESKPEKSAPQKALEKLGLVRDIDLALHLPLRYEDETRLTRLADALDVHPSFKAVSEDTPLATTLTPVYPTSAALPQAYLRKAVASGLGRADLDEILPAGLIPTGLPPLREALHLLHHPPPHTPLAALEDRSHPAWQRLKFEELLAQQLSQLQAQRERARRRAPALPTRREGCRLRSRGPSGVWWRRSRGTSPASSPCTACCRVTSVRARPWWPHWPRRSPSMRAGSVR